MNSTELEKRILELEKTINDIRKSKKQGFLNFAADTMTRRNSIIGIIITVVLASMVLYASQVTFTDGTVISANDVNNNFTELYDSINSLQEVPVGTVIDWWRPNDTFAVPDNFAICDGSQVTDTESPYYGINLPDLNGSFIRGTSSAGSIGATGGSSTHSHSAPAHSHSWAYTTYSSSLYWYSGDGTLIYSISDGMDTAGSGTYTLAISSAASRTFSTSSTAASTNTSDSLPPYYTLLKIIRIK